MPTVLEGNKITLTDVAFISSAYLRQPHGLDFIDDEKIIVANREGDVTTFELPSKGGGQFYELQPIGLIRSGELMSSPGAISVERMGEGQYEALVCNNHSNKVTRHLIDSNGDSKNDEVLLDKCLRFPDGISVSDHWIAISNNQSPHVLLYDRNRPFS